MHRTITQGAIFLFSCIGKYATLRAMQGALLLCPYTYSGKVTDTQSPDDCWQQLYGDRACPANKFPASESKQFILVTVVGFLMGFAAGLVEGFLKGIDCIMRQSSDRSSSSNTAITSTLVYVKVGGFMSSFIGSQFAAPASNGQCSLPSTGLSCSL